MNQSTQQDLRQILGKFLTGVTVITTLDQHAIPVGFTANSFTSVSLDPPLVLVCMAQSAGLAPVFRRAGSYAINILSTEQETISNSFARKDADRFAAVNWQGKVTGSPVIDGCAAWLDCEMYEKIIAGDHMVLIGRIVDAEKTARHPLGYYQGRYCAIDLPEETLSLIEHRESVHSTTGILVDYRDQLLLIEQEDGCYDVPRAEPGGEGEESRINAAMTKLGIEVHNKVLFSVVEGRHHQRISIYYRCNVEPGEPLPAGAKFFSPDALPLDQLSRLDLRSVLKRYLAEKNAGQFGIYVGDEHQGHIEQIAERKI
jgi:flavin reductase (DIM6/NTAB) family NADH-FMN oxidoreductase RutF